MTIRQHSINYCREMHAKHIAKTRQSQDSVVRLENLNYAMFYRTMLVSLKGA